MRYQITKKIKEILFTFCMVTTGIVAATLTYLKMFYEPGAVNEDILWQILITAFLCSLGNLIHPMHEVGRRRFWFNILLHYLYINIVVLGAGDRFGWFDVKAPAMVAGMMLLILVIFIIISFVIWNKEMRESKRLNEKLLEYQGKRPRTKGEDMAEEIHAGDVAR